MLFALRVAGQGMAGPRVAARRECHLKSLTLPVPLVSLPQALLEKSTDANVTFFRSSRSPSPGYGPG
jgi:hypothetical protein